MRRDLSHRCWWWQRSRAHLAMSVRCWLPDRAVARWQGFVSASVRSRLDRKRAARDRKLRRATRADDKDLLSRGMNDQEWAGQNRRGRLATKVGPYLESGWPGDNYAVTVAMALALVSRGWRYGRDLLYLCFPHAAHDEKSWGMRLHLPMQLFTGAVARASRSSDSLLNTGWCRVYRRVPRLPGPLFSRREQDQQQLQLAIAAASRFVKWFVRRDN